MNYGLIIMLFLNFGEYRRVKCEKVKRELRVQIRELRIQIHELRD